MIFIDVLETIKQITFLQLSLSILYLILGVVAGKFAYQLVFFFEKEFEINKATKKLNIPFTIGKKEASVVRGVLIAISIFIALSEIKMLFIVFRSLFLTSLIYLFLFLIISTKDYFINVFYSFSVKNKERFAKNSKIKIAGFAGYIKKSNRTGITLETVDGEILYVPMSYIHENSKNSQ